MQTKTLIKKLPVLRASKRLGTVYSYRIILEDNSLTTVHISIYKRKMVEPQVVAFRKSSNLVEWCSKTNTLEAINGGFFLITKNKILGEVWEKGVQHPSESFSAPWHKERGAIYICPYRGLVINSRSMLPVKPDGDLLQAGPLLVNNGVNIIKNKPDTEGFSSAAHQFDSDITTGRYPRAMIGTNDEEIICIAADGRSEDSVGLNLDESANLLIMFGATSGLNLDGGGSTTLISNGKLINKPRDLSGYLPKGRQILSAITFMPA